MFTADQTWPFVAATLLLLALAVIEGFAFVLGGGISEWIDAHLDPAELHGLDRALGWLYVGRVPFLVLLVLFLAGFAMAGFALNLLSHRYLGLWLTPWIAVPLAFLAALPFVRVCGAVLSKLKLRDETYAVGFETLTGRVGVIVIGTAKVGMPAQAKVRNEFGAALYVMVEPDAEGMSFEQGESVLLVRQVTGNHFTAVLNPHPEISR